MTPRKKQRIRLLVVGILLLLVASIIVGFALKDGIEYYKSPSQVMGSNISSDLKFRLGGLVKAGSINTSEGSSVKFIVTDNDNSVPVTFSGILPDLFAENQGIIALGVYENGIFNAEELLAKHDESYMPKELVDMLKEDGLYVDPNE